MNGIAVERYITLALTGPDRELSIQYLTAGSGPPLVLLHGLADSARTWQWVIPALARTHTVYAPSLPGFGWSSKPETGYSPEFFTAVTAALLDALGLDRVSLVGNSLGGLVAVRLALADPDSVAALVLIASAGFGREVNPILRAMTWPGLGTVLPRLHRTAPGARLWAKTLTSLLFAHPERAPDAWRDSLYEMARRPGYLEATVATDRSIIDRRGQRDIVLDRLPQLTLPTLVLWGEQDRIVPVRQAHDALERLPLGRRVVLPECGHLPQIERADQVGALMSEFLAQPGAARNLGAA